ncbi:MAG: type II toxin-antitoxin system VapC family toxin [Micrococcales bacterium]
MATERAFLDTHVAYWLAGGSPSLSSRALSSINSFGLRVISSITLVELSMKSRRGLGSISDLASGFESVGIHVEDFTAEDAMNFGRFAALDGHDPFDRMLLAQAARISGTTFFTADRVILGLGLDWVVDAAG